MSRIGNKIITLPAGVEFTKTTVRVTVKGPKGELTREVTKLLLKSVWKVLEVNSSPSKRFKRNEDYSRYSRANLNNMVVGVSEGFKKELEMRGVGYRAQLSW